VNDGPSIVDARNRLVWRSGHHRDLAGFEEPDPDDHRPRSRVPVDAGLGRLENRAKLVGPGRHIGRFVAHLFNSPAVRTPNEQPEQQDESAGPHPSH
jgi:hypothetical protein